MQFPALPVFCYKCIRLYGHQNELCKIERRQKCCCGLFISELNENGLSCERKTKCDIALQTLYV